MKIKRKNVERISGSLSVHFFWPFCRALFVYYGKSWNGKKYPFANVKFFLYMIWIFFVNFIYFSQGNRKTSSVKKLKTKGHSFQFCKWLLFCHFKFFDIIEEMGSCQSQTPNWIPIHFLFSSLLIWFTIYHWPHPAPTALPNPSTDSSALPVA